MKTKEESVQSVKDCIKNLNEAIKEANGHNLKVTTKQEWHSMSNAAAPDRPLNPPLSATITETIGY